MMLLKYFHETYLLVHKTWNTTGKEDWIQVFFVFLCIYSGRKYTTEFLVNGFQQPDLTDRGDLLE